jgi:two-component system nitrogen regulation sensor histidine kinase NtrY
MKGITQRPKNTWQRRLRGWLARVHFERRAAIGLTIAAIVFGLLTYLVMTDFWDWDAERSLRLFSWLILADLFVVLFLGTLIARHAVVLWMERRRGLIGARLHARMVLLFGLVALIPAIFVSVFSTTFLNYGLDIWFGDKFKDAIEGSLNVSQSYLSELAQRVGNDSLSIANTMREDGTFATLDSSQLSDALDRQLSLRGLAEGVIVDRQRRIVAHGQFSLSMEFDLEIGDREFLRADEGETVVKIVDDGDRVLALTALDPIQGLYLYCGQQVDEGVLSSIRGNETAVRMYRQLERDRSSWQFTVAVIFAVLALLLVMAAISIAINFASQMVRPIMRLVGAAQRLGGGDLAARVKVGRRDDELSVLSRSFNTMAQRLATQQGDLLQANRQIDDRRRFTELVLSGVSAGVIGLNERGEIELPNRVASELLGVNLSEHLGHAIETVSPDLAHLVALAKERPNGNADGEISLTFGPTTKTLHVRVVSEKGEGGNIRIVVTFDDVTELLSAQRKAAWADIARRIAHEIKNPLTPIQLSAERLKRKYLKEITSDPETFSACTDTIVRHVGDIGRMVDEFSSFARMPAPVLRHENVGELISQAAFLQQAAYPEISFEIELIDDVQLNCDAGQITRALTNLLLNAAESISAHKEDAARRSDGAASFALTPGRIRIWMNCSPDGMEIGVDDNGRGLPAQGRERLAEPYVTTRVKGTGLGLAIVKKIMDDHGGKLALLDAADGGASIRLRFPPESVIEARPARKARV